METMTAAEYRAMKPAKRAKYGNKRTEWRGMTFDSLKELYRYQYLLVLAAAGEIAQLERQQVFELVPAQDGERAVTYHADFVYQEKNGDDWINVIEDVKSPSTRRNPLYILKRKLMLAKYGIRIREV
jgi:hypothetical protein